ncbi:hypothetical protein BM536_029660 [Streptomyces phaeoluteigriseus]|uniref:DUF3152 domain-containing protein n=1 Tax=Streptomyces phaeoluteigriseus TaxID=114686 RepID=A0A1V6MKW8_9ACTN|nr:DUF3152 domain-containing protein [Streptomyces phaeoluteigriseus]OQD53091.1 hypothetical protein BM536_029660 [Streptomyces phaeoluteigriseus]
METVVPLPGHRRAGQHRRRARRRLRLLGTAAVCAAVGTGVAAVFLGTGGAGPPPAAPEKTQALPSVSLPSPVKRTVPPSISASPSTQAPQHRRLVEQPAKGRGAFTAAQATRAAVGHGTVRRYTVQVEDGIGIDPDQAAGLVHQILADERGWTRNGHNGFRLVASGPYDFTVKIASPATVDRICGAVGLNTHSELNCNVGAQVMVNSTRWNTGSPQFTGPLDDYRALIINHEVGHRIGHGHEGCTGPGRPAPVMMQQIKGLHGCLANAWPHTTGGTYLSGPSVP